MWKTRRSCQDSAGFFFRSGTISSKIRSACGGAPPAACHPAAKASLTLDIPVLEQVQKLAEQEDRSLSSYINLVLKAHLASLKQGEEA